MTTILLHGVRWETYEALSCDLQNQTAPRLAFDGGTLEIMSSLPAHEQRKDLLTLFVNAVAEEREVDIQSAGSSTFRRVARERGFEPDACFYVQSVERLPNDLSEFDAQTLPVPDLVIEIDITHPSLNKLPLYAALGVTEVWRDDGLHVQILRRDGENWMIGESAALPGVTSEVLTRFIARNRAVRRVAWLREIRKWARQPRNEEQIP